MIEMTNALEREFLEAVGPAYLARARPPRPEAVRNWRNRSPMPLLNRLHGPVTRLSSHHADLDGHRVVWMEGGNRRGDPVVFVHGFGASKENWLPLLPFLAGRYHLWMIDLPGWGESQFDPDADYGMDHQVERLARWLREHLGKPAHLVGSSMGGGISGLLAARHPELVRSLTLMNAAGVAGSGRTAYELGLLEGRNDLVARNMRGVFRLMAMVMSSRVLAALMAPVAYGDMVARRHVNEHLFRHLMQHRPDPGLPSFASVGAPTLVLWGVEDGALHVSCADTFKQLIPHARVARLDGIGHLPMVETPRVTARLLRRLWRETEPRRERLIVE